VKIQYTSIKLNKIKYSYSPETPPTIRRISNSCKFAEYSHVVECEYELRHIPTGGMAYHLQKCKRAVPESTDDTN